jgi:hypothetical protein
VLAIGMVSNWRVVDERIGWATWLRQPESLFSNMRIPFWTKGFCPLHKRIGPVNSKVFCRGTLCKKQVERRSAGDNQFFKFKNKKTRRLSPSRFFYIRGYFFPATSGTSFFACFQAAFSSFDKGLIITFRNCTSLP